MVCMDTPPDATRYLCAAAHLDGTFRNEAIAQLLENKHRAVAWSGGVHATAVLRHCLVARRRKTVRDWALCALLVVGVAMALSAGDLSAVMPAAVVAWILLAWGDWFITYRVMANQLSAKNFTLDLGADRPGRKIAAALETLAWKIHER